MSEPDILEQLAAKIAGMSPDEKKQLDRELAQDLDLLWRPDPRNKPQVEAFYSPAEILLYGGAAGGGKTDLLLGVATMCHENAVIFRNQYVDLRGFVERIRKIFPPNQWNGGDYILRHGNAVLELGALAKPGAEEGWQGRPHDFIGFDEGAQINVNKVQFVIGWLRSVTVGQRKRIIIASNPPLSGDGAWLLIWFAPWLDPMHPLFPTPPGTLRWGCMCGDGEIVWVDGPGLYAIEGEGVEVPAKSYTFIPALLKDNPYLAKTGYERELMSMREPLRTKLMTGDFMAGREDHAMQIIPSAHVELAMARSPIKRRGATMTAIAADVAISKDNTSIARLWDGYWFDDMIRKPGKETSDGPSLGGLIIANRRGEAEVGIDMTGGYGIAGRDHLRSNGVEAHAIVFSHKSLRRDKSQKFKFKNKRTEMYWLFAEALDPESGEDIRLPNDAKLKEQLIAGRYEVKNGVIVMEEKADIIERTGSSPDDADAVVIAWAIRKFFQTPEQRAKTSTMTAAPADDPLDWE